MTIDINLISKHHATAGAWGGTHQRYMSTFGRTLISTKKAVRDQAGTEVVRHEWVRHRDASW